MIWTALGLGIAVAALVVVVVVLLVRDSRRSTAETVEAAASAPVKVEPQESRAAEEPTAEAPHARTGPSPQEQEQAGLVSLRVIPSNGVVVEIANNGSHLIRDVVLSEIRLLDHPDWTWRPAGSVEDNKSVWWRINAGESAHCHVEFLDGEDVVSEVPSVSACSVHAFWGDTFGNWWALTANGLPAAAPDTSAGHPPGELPRMTSADDSELRQLTWFASFGQLSDESRARLADLKARDRRSRVRDARPDPITGQADEAGPRLTPAVKRTTGCGNCGYEAEGGAPLGFCPHCGQMWITA